MGERSGFQPGTEFDDEDDSSDEENQLNWQTPRTVTYQAEKPPKDTYRGLPAQAPARKQEASSATILQFTSALYFVEEDEGEITIDIMRLGNQEGRVSCYFVTEDGSGRDGERYEAAEGEIVFERGEPRKSFQVSIVKNPFWRATLEFKVRLMEPEGCMLGTYLHTCRVKVIDKDSFPSSKYPEVRGSKEEIQTIGGVALFREYCWLNLNVPGVAWRTFVSLLFDQLKNVYLFYKLNIMAYMLNFLFNDIIKDPKVVDERVTQAMWIGLGYMLPMFLLHGWDLIRVRLDVHGLSQNFLQQSIVRKYLNYDDDSRQEVAVTDLQLAVHEDAKEMSEGYMAVLSILELFGKLIVLMFFTLHKNPEALPYVFIMPAIMFVFGCMRHSSLYNASLLPDELASDMLAYVVEIAKNYPLIADYFQRPKINETFAQKVSAWRIARLKPSSVMTNNDYFTKWLGPVFVGLYIMMEARNVLTGALRRGTFIATLSVFSEISDAFSEGYKEFTKISSIAGCVQEVTEMLNRSTDLKEWERVNRKRREATKAAREALLRQQVANHPFPTDLMQFEINKVSYKHRDDDRRWMLKNVTLSAPQGGIVAVMGSHGSGKQTLLRLLGHRIFPTEGDIFFPTHLRVLHVSQDVYTLDTSVAKNLTFGVGPSDVDHERIKRILRDLDAEELLNELEKDPLPIVEDSDSDDSGSEVEEKNGMWKLSPCQDHEEQFHEHADGTWEKRLNYSTKAKLHLARALIMNPEVMVLQRPLIHYDNDVGETIMKLLRLHVDNRGIHLPAETKEMRRPRTVFLSMDAPHPVADVVWKLDQGTVKVESTPHQPQQLINPLGASQRVKWPSPQQSIPSTPAALSARVSSRNLESPRISLRNLESPL